MDLTNQSVNENMKILPTKVSLKKMLVGNKYCNIQKLIKVGLLMVTAINEVKVRTKIKQTWHSVRQIIHMVMVATWSFQVLCP